MKQALYSLLGRSWRNVQADIGSHLGTFLAVGLAISIPLVFGLVAFNLSRLVESFIGQVEMVAYVSVDASPDQVRETAETIRRLPPVKTVTVVTKEEALQRFAREMPDVADLVREMGDNPLPPSMEIVLRREARGPAAMAELSATIARLPGIVELDDGRQWVDRLGRFTRYLWLTTVATGLFLALAAGLLVANTIRLAIYRRREEITIYRLVGATNHFIRGPLLVEGLLQGLFGAAVGLGIAYGLFRYVKYRLPAPTEVSTWLLGAVRPVWLDPFVSVGVLAIGGALGFAAAYLSTRRFLRV
ncbi:MAG: ABC transporter permease [Myxococcales bacterium]|nr:ABC transporter permease [Myxococcales bacterium]